jgi:hypothetical protein
MNLAHPAALFWLALAVPLVVCYLLRIRLRRVDVPTHLFWGQVFPESRRAALWGRLQHAGSLLVQLLLLALLAFALAEPVLPGEALTARHLVVLLDHSASMSARDGECTRLERARAEARRLVAGLRAGDEAALVTCGAEARVACALTGHRGALARALDAVRPDDGPGNVPEALALARRLLAGVAGGRVVVISDGCFDGAAALAVAPDVRWLPVGRAEANAGIRQFQVRRSVRDPSAYEVLIEVTNPAAEPLACRLFLERDGNPVDVLPVRVEADDVWRHAGEYASVEGGTLTARLDHADALAPDDRAFAVLPPRRELEVRLVSPGSLFLEKVLEASPLVRQPVAVAQGRDEAGTTDTGAVPPVTVYHQKPPGRLPAGPVVVIDPRSACDLWELGEALADPLVAEQDREAPLLTHVKLEGLALPRARRLKPLHDRTQVLAKALGGEPLCFTVERPEGRVFVLTGDLEAGELPLRTAFPILMSNALVWLAGGQENYRAAVPTGSVVELTLPEREGLRWFAPDGRAFALPAGAFRASVGPLDQVGVWRAAAGDEPPVAEVACNLAHGRRSDLRPDPALAAAARPEEGQAFRRPLAFFLLCLIAGLLGLEWCLYHRRKIR